MLIKIALCFELQNVKRSKLTSRTKRQKMVRNSIWKSILNDGNKNLYNARILFFSFWREWVNHYVRATGARDNRGGTCVRNTQNSLQHKTVKFGERSNKPSDQLWYLSSFILLHQFIFKIYSNTNITSISNLKKTDVWNI